MTAWIVYVLLVGTLVAAAARLLEGTLRIAGRPVRWVWAGALSLTIALAALAPQRSTRLVLSSDLLLREAAGTVDTPKPADGSWRAVLLAALSSARLTVTAPVQRFLDAVEARVPSAAGRSLLLGSAMVSALLLLLLSAVYARFRRLQRGWPVAELLGVRVRVSPRAGPAVVGLSRPEIVIPSWLLERSADEQRLVLVHEREHVRAHDPLLLASACVAAALLPWHPAVWYMWSRLRLAVELDCDGRVLRRGVAAHSYGTLLIDLAERCSGLRFGAPALADTSSHLEQRLLAMKTRSSRFAHLRAGALGACAVLALLAACEAKLPTSADVENMNVASAEAAARKVMFVGYDSGATYFIDGAKATTEQAKALGPERIRSIEVTKQEFTDGSPRPAEIHITTRKPGEAASGVLPREESKIRIMGGDGSGAVGEKKRNLLVGERQFDGVVIIDGARVDNAAMNRLDPNDIVSIEVTKGSTAASLYPAPEAAKGVIKITTKKGAAKK